MRRARSGAQKLVRVFAARLGARVVRARDLDTLLAAAGGQTPTITETDVPRHLAARWGLL